MAGSLKYFVYVDDFGGLWAIKRDESNIENMLTTTFDSDLTTADIGTVRYEMPQNITPRFATFASTSTVKTKKITVPRPADYQDLFLGGGTTTVNSFVDALTGETFVLQSLTSESVTPVVVAYDTGLNDGDAT